MGEDRVAEAAAANQDRGEGQPADGAEDPVAVEGAEGERGEQEG
jgi:hypothetical protein